MSINRLTNEALKADFQINPPPRAQQLMRGVGGFEAGGLPASVGSELAVQGNQVSNALDLLVKYIPTEAVTLYVAALAAAPALEGTIPSFQARILYWAFLLLTPLLVFLVYVSKRASDEMDPVPPWPLWPWWEMMAATLAFAVWGLAVPGNPYVKGNGEAVLAGLGVIAVSILLNLMEPIVRSQLERLRPAPLHA